MKAPAKAIPMKGGDRSIQSSGYAEENTVSRENLIRELLLATESRRKKKKVTS